MINEQTDPNLAETPHYKEKQTILPNPVTIDHITGEKKLSTPVKRAHDGRPKKPLKFPDSPSPINNDLHSDRVLLTDKKSDDAKIDMRKLIVVEPKHRKRSTSSSGHKIHSSSSSSHSCSKEKHRGSSDHHRSSSNKSSKHRDEHRKSSSNHSSSSSKSKQNPSDVRQTQDHHLSSTSTTQSIVSVPAESIIIEHPIELNAINHVPPNYNDHLKAIICPPEPSTEQIIEVETVTSPPQLMDLMSMDSFIEVSSTVEPELVETVVTDETSVVACSVFQTEPEFQSTMTLTPTHPIITPVTPKIKKNILKTPSSVTKPPPDLLSSILAGMDNTPNRNSSSSGPSSF